MIRAGSTLVVLALAVAAIVGSPPLISAAALGTCDPATRGDTTNQTAMQFPAPNGTGSVLVDIRYGWDGTSVKPDCDGPVVSIRTQNTSTQPAWALLPNKKRTPLWVQLDPGTDVTVNAAGQLNNLGLRNYSDCLDAGVTFTQPG